MTWALVAAACTNTLVLTIPQALEDAASKARLGVGAAVRSEDEDPTAGIVVLTSYYYDFETATTADALPMNARLIPPPPAPAYHSAAVLEVCVRVCVLFVCAYLFRVLSWHEGAC